MAGLTQSARTAPRLVDEFEWGFGWVSPDQPYLRLTSHALAAGGGVWLVDPTDAPELDARLQGLGEPAGVIQLLHRHNRGCAAVAARLGVPHHRVPFDGIAGSPFEFVTVVRRRPWNEVALWWPERRVLACADALGSIPHYFALGGQRLGVHPLLRLAPPRELGRYDPEHVLCGHGDGVHGNATAAVREALATSRRRAPRLALELPLVLRKLAARRRRG